MKKLTSLILIFSMAFPSLTFATLDRKECTECALKTNAVQEEKIVRVCNDISDVVCKDVKLEERRSCTDSDEYRRSTSKEDLANFAKGCFKSSVNSMWQFIHDFLPEVAKGIWEATKATASLTANSISGNGPGLGSKLSGMYESMVSVTADLYEAILEDPGAYFDKLWKKIVDLVQPMITNFSCLNTEKKIEKVCGIATDVFFPPALLGTALVVGVKGLKEAKFFKKTGALTMTASGKLAKAIEFSEKRSFFSLKQLLAMEERFKALGYTRDEFALIYKMGRFEKVTFSELKPLTTAEGQLQRKILLGEVKPTVVTPKKAAAAASVKITSDFITIGNTLESGEKVSRSGQIVERIIENGKEAAYRVRMVDEAGKVVEVKLTNAQLARMNVESASSSVAKKVEDIIKKDGKHISPEDEFKAAQKAHAEHLDNINRPDEIKDFVMPKEAKLKEPKVEGMDVSDTDFGEFEKVMAHQDDALLKAKKEAETKAQVKYFEEQKRIKEKGAVEHDGMVVEELPHDDARLKTLFEKKETPTTYQNGIDYVPTKAPGVIVKYKERAASATKALPETAGKAIGPFSTNYIQVVMKNSMGTTSFMPAQIVKKVRDGTSVKYVVRMVDKTTNTVKERTVSLAELKLELKAREVPKVEKEIKEFNRQTGFQDDLTP